MARYAHSKYFTRRAVELQACKSYYSNILKYIPFPPYLDKRIRQTVFAGYDEKEGFRLKKKRTNYQKCAPCEDRTHDLQISEPDYETDALPTALTRHLQGRLTNFAIISERIQN